MVGRVKQRSLFHLSPWLAWDHSRRERERRAALCPTPSIVLPHWRRWSPSPIHAWMARLGKPEPKPCSMSALTRELFHEFVTTRDPVAAAELAPAFVAWVFERLPDDLDLELQRISSAVAWPTCAPQCGDCGQRYAVAQW